MPTKLSIIIPLYNHEKYIRAGLESCLIYHDHKIEIIVIDDGSKDKGAEIVNQIAAQDNRVKYYHQKNQGAHNAINNGITKSTGEFIAILNSDDIFDSRRFTQIISAFEAQPEIDAVFTGIGFINDKGEKIKNEWYDEALEYFKTSGDFIETLINANFFMTTSNLFIKKSVFKEIGPFQNLRYAHDLDFFLKLFTHNKKVHFIEEPLLYYRFHGANTISEGTLKVKKEWALVTAFFLSEYYKSHNPEEKNEKLRLAKINATLEKHSLTKQVKEFKNFYKSLKNPAEYYEKQANNNNKKILVLSNLYPPNALGGYERLCFDIISTLTAKGHEIIILTSDYGEASAAYDNQKIIKDLKLIANSKNIYAPCDLSPEQISSINQANIHAFQSAIHNENPDIVFVWNMYFFDKSLIDVIKNSNKKTIYFLSDNWLISFMNPEFLQNYFSKILHPQISSKRLLIRIYKTIKSIFRKSNKGRTFKQQAIFSSNYMKQLYKQSGINFSKDTLIYNGIDFSNIDGKEPIPRDNSLKEKTVKLLFAGRVVQVKGVHVLIKALSKLISKYNFNNFELTIIGDLKDEVYVNEINSLIEKSNLQDKVKFKDNVSETKLFEEFQAHDIYLFPSLYEPFSLTLIYALASGIPTIASNIGGNPEIVFDNQTGLIYDAFDDNALAQAIIKFINEPELRKKISKNSIQTAKEFTLSSMANKIDSYLRNT